MSWSDRARQMLKNGMIMHYEGRIKSFERRLVTARSLKRRARYGRQIRAAKVRLAVLRLEGE